MTATDMLLTAFAVTVVLVALPAAARPPQLPDQFIVTTGTTMPFPDLDPIAQSGAIYFDRKAGQMRIDNFWMGSQRTLLVDVNRQRAHMINGGNCVTSIVKGKLRPVAIPEAAARDHDVNSVRGVPVDHFHQVVREEDLLHIDYYLRKSNFTVTSAAREDLGEALPEYWVPWRVTSRRVERQEMIAAPERANPNWRFFGEEVSDAIVRFGGDGRALSRLVHGVSVTVDFYNFVPMTPDPNVFEFPEALCSDPPSAEQDGDLDLFTMQRNLFELSFNSEEGQQLMRRLWTEHDFGHELPPNAQKGDSKQPEGEL